MAEYKRAQFHVCIPGMPDRKKLMQNLSIKRIVKWLTNHDYKCWPILPAEDGSIIPMADKEYTFCMDSVPGFFRLDQDWLTFDSPAESDYGWVRPNILSNEEWTEFFHMVEHGYIIVMVFHQEREEWFPHR